jgi:hypothetical protein
MTMQQNDIPPEIIKAVPGALGSIVALRWINGTPMQRIIAVGGGAAGAYYGTPHLSAMMGTDLGLTGFLIGLFGMAVAAKCFELIAMVSPAELLDKLLKRWGL